jgi:hypothetical protein
LMLPLGVLRRRLLLDEAFLLLLFPLEGIEVIVFLSKS